MTKTYSKEFNSETNEWELFVDYGDGYVDVLAFFKTEEEIDAKIKEWQAEKINQE